MIDALYSREILRRTTQLLHIGHLSAPDAKAWKAAKLCGSRIEVEINLKDAIITDFAQSLTACALGQASAAILSQAVIGASIHEVFAGRDALRALLNGEDAKLPERFSDLTILASIKDFPARHASTLLAWEATTDAIEKALAANL
jgi:NifU-like protein involved in Fe-S cluster formation